MGKPAAAGTIRAWLWDDASTGADCLTMVRPMTISRKSQPVPLCMETWRESPSRVAGPSSLASSARGRSSSSSGSPNGDVVLVNERLQVTSGEETRKLLSGEASDKTGAPEARRVSASSTAFDRLSLSMTASAGVGFLRKLRATSPKGASVSVSCATARAGHKKMPESSRATATTKRFEVGVRTGNGSLCVG